MKKLYEINAEDPNLAATYEKVLALFAARSAKISEGMALKKAEDAKK